MDPVTALGAAGSVVGIASFGLQLSQILIKYISQVWSAQQSLEDIVEEIQSTTYALEGIYSYLAEEVDNIRRGYPLCLFSTTSLMKVKVTADRCLVVFWRIEATISGNWPAELEDHLVKKLTEFNNKLVSSSPDSMIASIGSQLTENPLGLRDKLQWPSKASKLAKYCGQLQRYQDNLQLLLQIVVLGQQRLKPNSAEEVIRMMLKSYAIISQVATPKELHIIAEEARAQSRTRRRNEGRDHSVARSHTKRPQTPVQSAPGNIPLDRLPINPDTRQHSVPQPESPSGPQSIVASAAKARSPRPVTPTQINRAIAHEHDYMLAPVMEQQSSGLSLAAAQKQPMQSTNLGNDIMSPITEEKTSRAQPIIAGFNGFVSDGQASQSNTSRKGASLRPVSDREGAGVDGVEAEPPFQKRTGRPEIQILPYVIHDGGAYQLPISLQSELQKTLRGALKFKNPERELAQRLALLSPNQIRTLQDILRYKSEEQIRKLVQLKVLKTSKLKFWQRGTQVMIAFVEGDVSSMPESILSTTDDTLSSRYGYPGPVQVQNSASDLEHVLPSVLNSSKGVNGILNSRTKQPSPESEMSATSPLPHLFHRNVINQIPSIVPNQNQPNSSGGTRLPGFQDVTAFLVNNEEWRKRLTEYRVWTIVPYLDSYLTRMPSHSWDRCLLSEDFLSVTDIKRRLSTLDKNSMTVLEKMSTLDVSQQIQVMRSVEEARTDGHEAASEWNIRQLEIIRTRRLFKPKNVKAIIVYVYRIPSSQAFRGPEDPQGPRPGSEINHGGGQNLEPQNPTKRRQRVSTDYDSNTSYDDNMTRRSSFDRLGNDEDRVKRIERLKREEIERQNYAIASRRPVPSVPTTSVGPSSLYGASRPATRSISPRPVIRGQSRSSSRYSDRAGYVGTFTSDNGFSSRGDPEYSDESYWARGTDYKGGDLPVQQRRMGEAETTEWFPRRRIAEQEYYPEESGRSTRNSYYGPASSMGRRNSYSTVSTHRNSSMATPRRKPYLLTYPRGDPTEDERYPSEFDREPYDLQLSQQEIEAYDKPIKQLLLDWTPQNDGDDDNISDPPSNEESQVDDTAGTLTANESSLGSRDKQPHYTTPTTTKQPEIQLDGSTMGHMIGSRVEPAHLQPHQLSPHPMLAGQSQIQADRSSQSPSPTLILEPSQAPSSLEEKRAAETEIGAEAAEAVLKGARKESDASITESAHWAREELSGRTPAKQEHLPNLQRRTTNENNRLHGETNQRSSSSDANTEDGHDAGDQTPRVEDWRGTDWARHIVEETAITAEPDEYESHTPRPGTRQTVDRELSPREREYESEFRRGRRRRDSERSRRPSSSHRIRDETRERYYRGSSERLPSQPVRRRTVEIEEPREGQYRGSAERLPPPNPPRRRTVEFEEPGDRQSPPSQRRGKGA